MKLKVEEDKKIEDGVHFGIIENVIERETQFKYIQIEIKLDSGIKKTVSYPANLQKCSKLGQLLERMGKSLEVGQEIELDELKGLRVRFQTITQKGKDGNKYQNIIAESVVRVD